MTSDEHESADHSAAPAPRSLTSPDLSWLAVLEHFASRTPDKPMAVCGDDIVTYREMLDRSAALAAGLQARGVVVGDVVGLLSYNNVEFLATIFGANYLGATVMPLNWRLAPAELRFILDHSQARALVCDEALVELAGEATKDRNELVRVCISPTRYPDWERFSDVGASSGLPVRVRAHGDDLHRLMY